MILYRGRFATLIKNPGAFARVALLRLLATQV